MISFIKNWVCGNAMHAVRNESPSTEEAPDPLGPVDLGETVRMLTSLAINQLTSGKTKAEVSRLLNAQGLSLDISDAITEKASEICTADQPI